MKLSKNDLIELSRNKSLFAIEPEGGILELISPPGADNRVTTIVVEINIFDYTRLPRIYKIYRTYKSQAAIVRNFEVLS